MQNSGSLSKAECYEMANKINQTFVDIVRATGGNNEQRFLLIAGYNTDITMTCSNKFQMPTDTARISSCFLFIIIPLGIIAEQRVAQIGEQRQTMRSRTDFSRT